MFQLEAGTSRQGCTDRVCLKLCNSESQVCEIYQFLSTFLFLQIFDFRYEQYSTSDAYRRKCAERASLVKSLTKQSFEVDLDDERASDDASQRASYASAHSDSTANSVGTAESGMAPSAPAGVTSTTRESWASSIVDLQQLTGDPVLVGVSDRISTNQMDSLNDGRRSKNRNSNFFTVYPIQHEVSGHFLGL